MKTSVMYNEQAINAICEDRREDSHYQRVMSTGSSGALSRHLDIVLDYCRTGAT